MTYSNTKRDKAQVTGGKKILKAAVAVFLLFLLISAVANTFNQLMMIREVNSKIAYLQDKVIRIKDENKQVEENLAYATTSAYKERKSREWLGMGQTNEVWIGLVGSSETIDLYHNAIEEASVSNVKKWFLLFTKQN